MTPPPAVPSPSLREVARRTWLALVVTILLGCGVIVGGVSWLGQYAGQEELTHELDAKAKAVAATIQRDVDRALAYGIPLDRIPGMAAYLDDLGADSPELRYLAVTDRDGHPLFEVGDGTLAGRSVTRLPLRDKNAEVGQVEVAVAYGGVGGGFGSIAPLVLGALALLLLAYELLTWALQVGLIEPLAELEQTLAAAAAGDFGTQFGRRGHDLVGQALARFNGVVAGLHDLTRRFHGHAQEVGEAVFDTAIAGQVATLREQVTASLGPSLSRPPQRRFERRRSDLQPFLFTLTLAATATLAAVFPTGSAAAPAATGALVLAALALISAVDRVPAGWAPLPAALAVTAAAALATFGAGETAPLAAASGLALFGLGLGLVVARALPRAWLVRRTLGGAVAGLLVAALGVPGGVDLALGAAALVAGGWLVAPGAAGPRQMPLRSRIILIASLAFAGLASLLVTASVLRQATDQTRLHQIELAGDDLVWQQIIDRQTEAMTAWLAPLLADPGLVRAVSAGDQPALAALAGGALAGGGAGPARLDVIRADGNLLYSSATVLNPVPLWSGSLLVRLVAERHSARGIRRIGDGVLMVTVAVPIQSEGRVLGTLVTAMPVDAALRHLSEALRTPVYAVDVERRRVFGEADPLWQAVAQAIGSSRRAISEIDHDGHHHQIATLPVSDVGGGLIGGILVVRDVSHAYATRLASDRAWAAGTVLLVLALLGLLYGYLRHAFEPLQEATATLEELARRRSASYLDLQGGGDEIGRVSAAVEFVRGTLRELERLAGQRERRRRRQERFIRRQMTALAATLEDQARQRVLDDLSRLGTGEGARSGEGDNDGDDLGLLAPAFGRMAALVGRQQAELLRLIQELREALDDKRRLISLQQELEIARTMQLSILPRRMPEHAEIDLAAHMIPAKEVGGDFYDFFFIDERRLGLVVADVSGKGIPAAFFMLITRTLLRALCLAGHGPGGSLRRLNDLLEAENDQMMFVTVFYGELDLATGILTYCNAGHLSPLVSGPNRAAATPLKPTGSTSLAVVPDLPYRELQATLAPGETLTVFSDGITEAFDADEQMFGDQRLADLVSAIPSGSAASHLTAITTGLDAFVGTTPQSDDITCLVLTYRGTGG